MRQVYFVVLGVLQTAVLVAPALGSERLSAQWPRFQRIVILPDTSGSLDHEEYQAVTQALCGELPDLVIAVCAREVALLPWAGSGDALRTASRAELPARPSVREAASRLSEGQIIFRHTREIEQEREAELQQAQLADLECKYRGEVRDCLDGLLARLAATRQGRSRCTDVGAILGRCVRELPGTLCLVITDGLQEGLVGPSLMANMPASSRVVVILVPGRDPSKDGESGLEARVRWMREIAPWASVAFSFQASGPVEDWLLPLVNAKTSGSGGPGPGTR